MVRCGKPATIVHILADDRAWNNPLGLCNQHKGTDCFRAGMEEDGNSYLTVEEFLAVGDLHGS